MNKDSSKWFMVHTITLKDANFCELQYKLFEEYRFQNDGVLKIIFKTQDFEEWMITRSKEKIRRVRPI